MKFPKARIFEISFLKPAAGFCEIAAATPVASAGQNQDSLS
jgi:hypothetical protein